MPPTRPVNTYRLQLNKTFTFADATGLVPYLSALGITDLYTSPFLKARAGSPHGYDIVDHSQLNPELGTSAQFESLSHALRERQMGMVLDFVPNHMGLDINENPWWRDVLQHGPSSLFADYFDIDWDPVTRELRNKILLPILEDQYGLVLDRGELRLGFDAGALYVGYFERRLPIDPRTSVHVLEWDMDRPADRPFVPADPDWQEYLDIIAALERLPRSSERSPSLKADRHRATGELAARLARLVERSGAIRDHVEKAVMSYNGVPGESPTYDRLHELLEQQNYRLAHWKTALDEINYRRFFDVNDLGGIRVEDDRVFDAAHGLVLRLVSEGAISGLRIDHADGLYDPAGYFGRLRRLIVSPAANFYIVGEKILAAGENLPEDWAIDGTTGYGFLNSVNGLFVDERAERKMRRIYAAITGQRQEFSDAAYHAKRLIMASSMASELSVLSQALKRIARRDRLTRDFTLNALQKALVEIVACFPVYRTYVNGAGFSAIDRAEIDLAIDRARQRNPVMASALFLFVRSVLLADSGTAPAREARLAIEERRAFAMKFQQFSAPVQAKGVEDTAYYRYNALLSLNEVGGDPRRFGTSVQEFHESNRVRLERWPLEMIATSTHDTKRGEDARTRIDALSEIPDEWRHIVRDWMRLNQPRRTAVDRESAPDRNDEYLFYQSLLGVWPAELLEADIEPPVLTDLIARLGAFMLKAIREAKIHTSWVNQNRAYEDAVATFVESSLSGPQARGFLSSFLPFARRIAERGMVNSLAQLILKVAAPGVADFYQGVETWQLDLADPDNRRPVDFSGRQSMLDTLVPWIERSEALPRQCQGPCVAADELEACVAQLAAAWPDGRIKMFLTACGLRLRARESHLILQGDYRPLAAEGARSNELVAFGRSIDQKVLLAVVPRLTGSRDRGSDAPSGDLWADTHLILPSAWAHRSFRNLLTGAFVAPGGRPAAIAVAEIFRTLPCALLWSESPTASGVSIQGGTPEPSR